MKIISINNFTFQYYTMTNFQSNSIERIKNEYPSLWWIIHGIHSHNMANLLSFFLISWFSFLLFLNIVLLAGSLWFTIAFVLSSKTPVDSPIIMTHSIWMFMSRGYVIWLSHYMINNDKSIPTSYFHFSHNLSAL